MSTHIDTIIQSKIPEEDYGNIEYKRQLININPSRLEQLVIQIKNRISEGQGECLYEIGIDNKGDVHGLNEGDYNESLKIFKLMAKKY